jgi:hypothetical protein
MTGMGKRKCMFLLALTTVDFVTIRPSFAMQHRAIAFLSTPPQLHVDDNSLLRRKHDLHSTTVLMGRRGSGNKEKKEKATDKGNLPEKICVVCARPFTWRKKWERCWDEVTCCSKQCNSERRSTKSSNSEEL